MSSWLTLDEAKEYLKVSRSTLYKLAQTEEIPASKIGRSWRFNPETLDAWLKDSGQKKSSSSTKTDSTRLEVSKPGKSIPDQAEGLRDLFSHLKDVSPSPVEQHPLEEPRLTHTQIIQLFLDAVQRDFGSRFSAAWLSGPWAQGNGREEDDLEVLIVLSTFRHFHQDFARLTRLAYEHSFRDGSGLVIVPMLLDRAGFETRLEPKLMMIREEGKLLFGVL